MSRQALVTFLTMGICGGREKLAFGMSYTWKLKMVHSCKVIHCQKLGSQERPEALVSKSRTCDATFHGKSCPAAAWQDCTAVTSTVCSVVNFKVLGASHLLCSGIQEVIENLVAASGFFRRPSTWKPCCDLLSRTVSQSFYLAILHPFIHTSRQGRDRTFIIVKAEHHPPPARETIKPWLTWLACGKAFIQEPAGYPPQSYPPQK